MYGYTFTDGAVLNKHGIPLKPRYKRGRAYVRLYYNGKAYEHSVAHVIACIANDIDIASAKCVHAHHIDGRCWNDWQPGNILPMCKIDHMSLHGNIKVKG